EISGLPTIMTAYADREASDDDFLTFYLPRPARVYIAYSTGTAQTPDWLRPFTFLKDMHLEVEDEWYGVRRLQLYSEVFPAGEVTLGGNSGAGMQGRADTTYLVVVERVG